MAVKHKKKTSLKPKTIKHDAFFVFPAKLSLNQPHLYELLIVALTAPWFLWSRSSVPPGSRGERLSLIVMGNDRK